MRLFLFAANWIHVARHADNVSSVAWECVRIESTAPTDGITDLGQQKPDCHLPSFRTRHKAEARCWAERPTRLVDRHTPRDRFVLCRGEMSRLLGRINYFATETYYPIRMYQGLKCDSLFKDKFNFLTCSLLRCCSTMQHSRRTRQNKNIPLHLPKAFVQRHNSPNSDSKWSRKESIKIKSKSIILLE